MFKKLRNKFLFINLIAIILVLLISFASIFMITYKKIESDVVSQLNQAMLLKDDQKKNNPPTPPDNKVLGKEDVPPSTSFQIEINGSKKIIAIHNPHFSNINNSTYTAMIEKLSFDKESNFFSLNGTYWAYRIITFKDHYQVAFVDISNNVSTLTSMLFAFLIVSIISIIIAIFFSKIFADRAIKPIKETFQKQKQFVSDASHELKTPLTIINTNIDLVLSNEKDQVTNQKKWLINIKDETSRMTKLTNNLLYLAKLDDHNIQALYHDFDFSSTLEEATLSIEGIAFEKGLEIKSNIQKNIIIHGSSEQLRQVIIILLDNAIKYSENTNKIEVLLTKQNKKAILEVINYGTSIDQEQQEKLFDRFYRADDSRNSQTGGHGLGLSIAKDIIQKHQGNILLNSHNHKTTIRVHLPVIHT
ncbi:HAMP domain-containing histidine kinase [Breznakia sp. OttesenSCG-928-G09]|nr:HAMP domain-containing histidine kinase [Breznakia sp. OttesenSCG-928-G09]